MQLKKETIDFIQFVEKKLPAEIPLLASFEAFLAIDPSERPAVAREKITAMARANYLNNGIPKDRVETIGEHINDMIELTKKLPKLPLTISQDNICKLIKDHHIHQAILENFLDNKTVAQEDVKSLEKLAVQVIFEGDSKNLIAWNEYHSGDKAEASMARDINSIQTEVKIKEYQTNFPNCDLGILKNKISHRKFHNIYTLILKNSL